MRGGAGTRARPPTTAAWRWRSTTPAGCCVPARGWWSWPTPPASPACRPRAGLRCRCTPRWSCCCSATRSNAIRRARCCRSPRPRTGWSWTWARPRSASAGATRSSPRWARRWRNCRRAGCACTCCRARRPASRGCPGVPRRGLPDGIRAAAAARHPPAAGAAVVAAGAGLVVAGGRGARAAGLRRLAVVARAPAARGDRAPVRRAHACRRDAGRTRRGDVRTPAPRRAAAPAGRRPPAGPGVAGVPRWRREGERRRRRPAVFRRPRARAARRRLPPRGRRPGRDDAAAAGARALPRADGGAAMSAWWPAAQDWFAGFAWPWLLLALPLPWLARRLLPPARSASAALRVPYGARLAAIAGGGGPGRGGRASWWLWLAWLLLCVAAARPQQLGEAVQPPQSGRDLMLAVDLSGSMGEEDMTLGNAVVDRLTAAKAVIADFLDRRAG